MIRTTICIVALLLLGSTACAEDSAVAKQYKALLDEYEKEGGARTFSKRFLALAEKHPKDSASADALLWVVKKVRGRADTARALKLLALQHVHSDRLKDAWRYVVRSRSLGAEKLLREVLQKAKTRQARAQACYYLAALLSDEANVIGQLKQAPELAARVLEYYGKDYGKYLSTLDAAKLAMQREKNYEQMLKSFADVKIEDTTMGAVAKTSLFALRHLAVGKPCPEIKGKDIQGKELKLSDFRGKVVMLTFWGHW